jgi:hypothetical protein
VNSDPNAYRVYAGIFEQIVRLGVSFRVGLKSTGARTETLSAAFQKARPREMNMLKKLIATLVITSAVVLAPIAAAAEDKMEHKEMNLEKNHMKREHRHHTMRHHGLMGHHHHPDMTPDVH